MMTANFSIFANSCTNIFTMFFARFLMADAKHLNCFVFSIHETWWIPVVEIKRKRLEGGIFQVALYILELKSKVLLVKCSIYRHSHTILAIINRT